jgi:predicted MFS family arabinose efflux permease
VAALVALGAAGTCAFINLYATQPLLPLLETVFGVSKAQAAWTVSAPTIAVALASLFVGALADRIGRRRLIVLSIFALAVPTALAATARNATELVLWRFAQGLAVPGIFAIALAFIGEAWQGRGVGRAMAALITGNVIGGFSGRLLSGLTADRAGWRASFLVLAALTLAGAAASARWLPYEPARAPSGGSVLASLRALAARVDRTLVATYAVAFNLLFTNVALFTYVTFHLNGPPYRLGVAQLSWLFVVYLVGALVTPFAGSWIDRVGSRRTLVVAFGAAIAGALLTLVPAVWAVVAGLAVCCTANFIGQSASTSFLQAAAPGEVRSSASGVYVSSYYVGGSAGGIAPVLAWNVAGWPGCVALVIAVQVATIAVALRWWKLPPPAARARG